MSRTIRLLLAAVAVATVAAPALPASADPIILCRMYMGDEIARTSDDFPVQISIGRPQWAC